MQRINFLEMHDADYLKGIAKELQDQVHSVLYDFDYDIVKETIKEDSAEVIINFKSKDIYDSLQKAQKEATKKTKALFKKNPNYASSKVHKEIMNIIYSSIKDIHKVKEYQIPIHLIKKDDQWIVADDNHELESALLENATELIEIMNQ